MTAISSYDSWGAAPWKHRFISKVCSLPRHVDFAIVGGGFSGLTAGAWLRQCAPERSVAVFERRRLGFGGSGRTGGITLAQTATGDLPGLGDVLDGFRTTVNSLGIECDAVWNGVYEIAHGAGGSAAVLRWNDSGPLDVVNEVSGGSLNAGLLLEGLARATERLGALVFEDTAVEGVHFEKPIRLETSEGEVKADCVLFATNACALELSGLDRTAEPKFTLAVATEPLKSEELEALGLGACKPFYTVDLPYLWGRTLRDDSVIFGCGLVDVKNWREIDELDIRSGEPARLLASLEERVRGLHPVLNDVQFSHRWGGPILIPNDGRLFFHVHPQSENALVMGGFTGQGVTLSVHLGRWAAEALLGQRDMPKWNSSDST